MIIIMLLISISLHALSLQEVYDNADSFGEYDKYLILSNDTIYTGGLGLYEGKTFIDCNGSIINLQDGNGIWVYADVVYPSSLVMEYCSVTNGPYYGISFGGMSEGDIRNCNRGGRVALGFRAPPSAPPHPLFPLTVPLARSPRPPL